MPIPDLADYIQEQTQQGASAQELRISLMEAGWQELDIENALHDVAAGLHPATPGASIHEDLAQVRGMVAHLASRVKGIETAIATFATVPTQQTVPVQAKLPTAFIGADHELSGRHGPGVFSKTIECIIMLVFAVILGIMSGGLANQDALIPAGFLIGVSVFALVLLLISIVRMRHGHAWSASLLCAGALSLGAAAALAVWRVNHLTEWYVAGALGILCVVIAFVTGRWISRLAR